MFTIRPSTSGVDFTVMIPAWCTAEDMYIIHALNNRANRNVHLKPANHCLSSLRTSQRDLTPTLPSFPLPNPFCTFETPCAPVHLMDRHLCEQRWHVRPHPCFHCPSRMDCEQRSRHTNAGVHPLQHAPPRTVSRTPPDMSALPSSTSRPPSFFTPARPAGSSTSSARFSSSSALSALLVTWWHTE